MSSRTPGARRPNRRGQGALLRAEIVRAAGEIVDETGLASAVTLSAVARRVGIAAPSIYAHFAGPDAILLAVVGEEFAALHTHLGSAVDAAGADVVARLRAACTAYLHRAETRPRRYLLMLGGIWDAAPATEAATVEHADVAQLGQASLDFFESTLVACVEAGRSASADPAVDARLLWVALHGLAHQRIVSTALTWPAGIEDRLIHRLAHL